MAIKTDLQSMIIGDKIICEYVATSGVVGTFSKLGTSVATLIPVASSATPNGSFYYIYVGDDFRGKKILIADRNVQHSISWDVLNTSGIASGSGLPITLNIPSYSFATRLLTGGVSSTDTDNEWDNYIVNSTLNGTITAGDNNVWNWNVVYSWISTIPSVAGQANNRVTRGYTAANTWTYPSGGGASASSLTNLGFRPVLIIEYIFIVTNKYLINDGGVVKTYNAGWQSLGAYPPSEATYLASGFTDLTLLTDAILRQLTSPNPSLLFYTNDSTATSRTNRLTAVPPAKLIKSLGDIDLTNAQAVTAVNLTASVSGGGVVKVVVSVDSGVTWKTWNGSGWIVVDTSNIANVANNGMTPAVLNARVVTDWNTLIGTARVIRFAYYLSMAASTDSAATDLITLTMDMVGSWNKATHNTDYTYGYIRNDTIKFTLSSNGDYKINY